MFVAMQGNAPFFTEETWIAERKVCLHRLPKKKFSFLVCEVVCFGPPVEGPHATLPLMALHPFQSIAMGREEI